MQKIIPNIWFDRNGPEAADFYADAFDEARVVEVVNYPTENLPDFQQDFAGQMLTFELDIDGYRVVGINAGSEFWPTPATSFMVNFDPSRDDNARDNLNKLWAKLSDGGAVRMALGKYDFSPHYGWVEDKYGVNWQLMLTNPEGEPRPFIIPNLLFTGAAMHQADEARRYYVEVFDDARDGAVVPYPEAIGEMRPGDIMFSDFTLAGQWFAAMDGGSEHDFSFSEGVSFQVNCRDQDEIDYYWSKLSHFPENEQCGWCKDRFGVSWQIVPEDIGELMKRPGAYQTLLEQKKIIIDGY